MDPNESFDYDRLDALLREIGYEDPDTTAQTTRDDRPTQAALHTGAHPPAAPRRDPPAPRPQPAPRAPVQAAEVPDAPAPKEKKKRKHRFLKFLLRLLLTLAALLLAAALVLRYTGLGQPRTATGLGARKSGCSTILLAGTDAGGTRTDTIMLCTINAGDGKVSLLSIPRDTLVNDSYSVPKINGTYGVYGGGEDGMEALMHAVTQLIGFRPDGYALIDLSGFVTLIDALGGVEFNVPVDMDYADPAQGLNISLNAGVQTLTGEQAMGLVRYRSGYAMADLERVNVQRDFLSACMEQFLTLKNVAKLPKLLPTVLETIQTDLSSANLLWCASAIMRCDLGDVGTDTLPGSASYWNGGSYYIVAPYDTVALINERYNPYTVDVTIYDLDVRTP